MQTQTNATDHDIANRLATIPTDNLGMPGQGTMVSLVVTKKGKVTGGAVQGDDTVHVLLWTGFHYLDLVKRSHAKLDALWSRPTFYQDTLAEAIALGAKDATLADVAHAVTDLNNSLIRSINIRQAKNAKLTAAEPGEGHPLYWSPLMVDGNKVLGAKVYIGDRNDIPKGTIYLDGVKLGQKVIVPADIPKGKVKSSNRTFIKKMLEAKLPIGLYVRYKMESESVHRLDIGDDAVAMAKEKGLGADPAAIRMLFKIAA